MKSIMIILMVWSAILLITLTNIMFQQNGEIQELRQSLSEQIQEKEIYVNRLKQYENQ